MSTSLPALDTGLFLLRAVAGVTMAAHGYQKFFSGGRIAGTARWFEGMGMRPGRLHALAAATTEVVAGSLLALGLLTSLAGAAFVGLMVVAGWAVHRENGFFSVKSGWEYNLVLATIGAAVGIAGAGNWSLDAALDLTSVFSGITGFVIAVIGGLVAGIGQLVLFFRPEVIQ